MQQNEIKIYILALPSNLLSVLIVLTASRYLNKKTEEKNAKHLKCVLARLKKKPILNCSLIKWTDLLSDPHMNHSCCKIFLMNTSDTCLSYISLVATVRNTLSKTFFSIISSSRCED